VDDPRGLREGLAIQLVRRPFGEHFVEDHAERVDVRPGVERRDVAGHLLRAHVAEGAQHLAGSGLHRREQPVVRPACDSEVEDLRFASFGDEDVRRLEIAVDDAPMVRVLNGVGNRGHQQQPLPNRRGLRSDVLVEPFPSNELHREVRLRAIVRILDAGLIDLCDAWVVKAAEELVFELESTQRRGRHDTGPHDLQRDTSMRPLLFRFVDDAHGAFADRNEDSEWADTGGL
jgi:hypothetical protein